MNNLLFSILLLLLAFAKGASLQSSSTKDSFYARISNELGTKIIEKISNLDIKEHGKHSGVTRESIRKAHFNSSYEKCYLAFNNYNKNLFEGDSAQMILSSFTEIGDLGNYERWKSIPQAAYYILQLNITHLPIELRVGICFPEQCTQDMLNLIAGYFSDGTGKLVRKVAEMQEIDMLIEHNVTLQTHFYHPDTRNKLVSQQNSTVAPIALTVVGVFFLLTVVASLTSMQLAQKRLKETKQRIIEQEKLERLKNNTNDESNQYCIDPFERTTKAIVDAQPVNYSECTSRSSRATNEFQFETQKFAPGKFITENDRRNMVLEDYQEERSLAMKYLNCFNISKNLGEMLKTKRSKEDDEELEVFEALKVLLFWWGVICATSLYVLTSSGRNIPILLKFFSQYDFAFISAGNLVPEAFFFMIYFFSFIKINQYYDRKGVLKTKNYLWLFLYRVLKMAPLYYFVFLIGWALLPLASNNINWFGTDRLFHDWDSQWPYVLTFLNTYFPFFTQALRGCFYWPYLVPNDLQLYIFFPIWIIVYRKNKNAFLALMLVLQLVGLFIHGFIGYYYNLSVGIMTLDDYYLWSYQFNKAHTKVSAISFGLTMAYIYLRILEYRKSNDDDKKKNFKIIDFMHKSTIVTIFLYLYSILIFAFITLIVRSANDDAYSWSRMQNTLYTIAARPLLLTVIMSLLLIIFMGKGHIAKYLMTSRIWLPLSNLTYAGYLIYPIVIGANFYASQRAFFITNPSIIFAMLSNIIICYLGALVLHIFVQAPIDRVLKTTYQVVRNSRGSLETMSEQESLLEPNEITKL